MVFEGISSPSKYKKRSWIANRLFVFLCKTVVWVRRLVMNLLIKTITIYQKYLSALHYPCCRFFPSCSVYAKESLAQYGLVKGTAKTLWRLSRCHPLAKGGIDLP